MATLALHRFRDGKAGVVWVETIAGMRELILDEHELVLGHERGDTAAPGVPEAERHVFTGGCMEHPVAAVPGTGTGGASTGKTGVPLSGGEAQRRSHLPCYLNMALARKSPALETPVAEGKRLCRMVRIQEGGEQDIRESPRPAAAGRLASEAEDGQRAEEENQETSWGIPAGWQAASGAHAARDGEHRARA